MQTKTMKGYGDIEGEFCEAAKNVWVTSRDGKPKFDRGEIEIAKFFAKEFPDKTIVVSIGPWRSYDIAGEISEDGKKILLDIYSVRVPSVNDQYVTDLVTNAHIVFCKDKKGKKD